MLTSKSHLSCHFQPSVVTLALSRLAATTTSSHMISTNLILTPIASSS